jgi:ribosomal protein S6
MSRGGEQMRNYEVMTIHRPEIVEDDVRVKVAEIEGLLKARGAEISETDFWGKRRFAYEIDHIREGYYSASTRVLSHPPRIVRVSIPRREQQWRQIALR